MNITAAFYHALHQRSDAVAALDQRCFMSMSASGGSGGRYRLGQVGFKAKALEHGRDKQLTRFARDIGGNFDGQLEQPSRFAFRGGMHGVLDQSGPARVSHALLAVNPQQPNQWNHAVPLEGRNR